MVKSTSKNIFPSFLKARQLDPDAAEVFFTFEHDGSKIAKMLSIYQLATYKLDFEDDKPVIKKGELEDDDNRTVAKQGFITMTLDEFNLEIYYSMQPILIVADWKAWNAQSEHGQEEQRKHSKLIKSCDFLRVFAFDDNAKSCMWTDGTKKNVHIFYVNPIEAMCDEDYFKRRIEHPENYDQYGDDL
jgi:hypothetical protein